MSVNAMMSTSLYYNNNNNNNNLQAFQLTVLARYLLGVPEWCLKLVSCAMQSIQ